MTVVTGTLAEPDLTPVLGQQLHVESILVPPDETLPRTRLTGQDLLGALLASKASRPTAPMFMARHFWSHPE